MNIFKTLLLTFTLTSYIFANSLQENQDILDETFDNIIKVVQDTSISKDQRNEQIVSIIDPIFDFELMAKLSIGKTWFTFSKDQQKEFVDLYIKRMKTSYSEKLDGYTNEKVKITKAYEPKVGRMNIETQIVGLKDSINIIYKFYDTKKTSANKKQWLIYDVEIEGISTIKTDRSQFTSILARETVEQFLTRLKN